MFRDILSPINRTKCREGIIFDADPKPNELK